MCIEVVDVCHEYMEDICVIDEYTTSELMDRTSEWTVLGYMDGKQFVGCERDLYSFFGWTKDSTGW